MGNDGVITRSCFNGVITRLAGFNSYLAFKWLIGRIPLFGSPLGGRRNVETQIRERRGKIVSGHTNIPNTVNLGAVGVLVRRLPLAAWALCPAWSPKVPQAAQHNIYVAVRAPARLQTGPAAHYTVYYNMYVYIYIYIYIHTCYIYIYIWVICLFIYEYMYRERERAYIYAYVYIYIYTERERDRERER